MLNTAAIKETGVERKFTLYITSADRIEIDRLRESLTPQIAGMVNAGDYLDKKGHLSVAAMFRYLRHQEMEKRGLK